MLSTLVILLKPTYGSNTTFACGLYMNGIGLKNHNNACASSIKGLELTTITIDTVDPVLQYRDRLCNID